MRLLETLFVAISTYSVVPVPQFSWREQNMKYAICLFPVVGLLCGALLWSWSRVAMLLQVSGLLFAVGAVCLPLLLTGGIHMDGYMDTVDALSSHQSRERKLEILKDPHCGAFAVLYCGMYLLAQVGLFYELYQQQVVSLLCISYVLSRTLSALCAVNLPNARRSGMLCAYTQHTDRRRANGLLLLWLLGCGVGLLLLGGRTGLLLLLASGGTVLWYRAMAGKQFGGITGDTAGFFLQLCELSCLLAAWLGVQLL